MADWRIPGAMAERVALRAAEHRRNTISLRGVNPFLLLDPQSTKASAKRDAQLLHEASVESARFRTAVTTAGDIYWHPTGESAHADVVMKLIFSISFFRDHHITQDAFDEAVRLSKVKEGANLRKWVDTRQRGTQREVLKWFATAVEAVVEQTGGLEPWELATGDERRRIFAKLFNEAPITISRLAFKADARVVPFPDIFALDAQRFPEIQKWRTFVQEVFVDLAEVAYTFAAAIPEQSARAEAYRQSHWKWMTKQPKYNAMKLQDVWKVPCNPTGYKLARNEIGFQSLGDIQEYNAKKEAGIEPGRSARYGLTAGREPTPPPTDTATSDTEPSPQPLTKQSGRKRGRSAAHPTESGPRKTTTASKKKMRQRHRRTSLAHEDEDESEED